MLFVTLTLANCISPKPEIRYIDKPYEVKVPVKCIVPKTECDFNRKTDTEVIAAMMECIINLIKNSEVCSE